MKIWEPYIGKMGEFLAERGVDMPRAWSLYCRQENCVNDHMERSFAEFLKAEYPTDVAAWRILR